MRGDWNDEYTARMLDLFSSGWTAKDIAKEIGWPKSTVCRRLRPYRNMARRRDAPPRGPNIVPPPTHINSAMRQPYRSTWNGPARRGAMDFKQCVSKGL